MRTYNLCLQKKNRALFAAEVKALADRLGATCRIEAEGRLRKRETRVVVQVGHYAVSMHFDGESSVNTFLGHWHMDVSGPNWRDLPVYPKDFAGVIGGSMNEIHWGKATSFEQGFDGFLVSLERGIERLKPILAEANIGAAPLPVAA
jgi:hypothetical protein